MPWKVKYPVKDGKKRCSKCKKVRDVSEFYVRTIRGKPKIDSECCHCARTYTKRWVRRNPQSRKARNQWKKENPERSSFLMWRSHIKRHYGITPEDYERMEKFQNGLCALCLTHPSRRFDIDHSHETKEIRGLLCGHCNGLLHKIERAGWLERCIRYLKLDYSSEAHNPRDLRLSEKHPVSSD